MTNRAIAHARLRSSRLVGPGLATPEDVVGWFGAVQSQDVPGALWGIAQRLTPDGLATIDHGRRIHNMEATREQVLAVLRGSGTDQAPASGSPAG